MSTFRPWRKVRAIAHDLGVDAEAAWSTVKRARLAAWRPLPLLQDTGRPFGISMMPFMQHALHTIDRATGGGGPAAFEPERGALGDPEVRARLRIRTLMDEAAESSLIEGAATTRADAVELLRAGREPTTAGERMVVNNYLAMQRIKEWVGRPLSPEMLCELQSILTRDTLERADQAGRFRRADEPVRIDDARTNETIFTPPRAELLPERLKALCAFANAPHDQPGDFLHPIVKACVLHFMIGYEHPFCDGNGRTARAVFYWFAFRNGYSIFEYTAISEIIRKGYARYPQAYLDTESDDGDLAYFVQYKLDVIELALRRLAEHIAEQEARIKRSAELLRISKDLNLRQRLLIEHALRHPLTQYTVKSHMNSNGITPNTSRSDLESLVKRRLMVTGKRGKQVLYLLAPGVADRLQRAMKKRG